MLTLFAAAIISLLVPEGAVALPSMPSDAKSSGVREEVRQRRDSSDSTTMKTLPSIAVSATYGYTSEEPILMGDASRDPSQAVRRTYRYLNSLRGPEGEEISYTRLGSCCPFDTKNAELGSGMLDQYKITYKGLAKPKIIYVNIYDAGEVLIPKGLTFGQ